MVIGGGVGIISGYFGGWVDVTLMRITDYLLVIPDLVFAMVIADIWGPSLFHVILVIGILEWTSTARVIRAQVMSVKQRVYIKRARALGAGHTPDHRQAHPAAGRTAADRQHRADRRDRDLPGDGAGVPRPGGSRP